MIKSFKLTRVNFHQSVKTGDIFDYEENKWVIIKILKVDFRMRKEPVIIMSVVAQQVNSYLDYSMYESSQRHTDIINLNKLKPFNFKPKEIGTIVKMVGDNDMTMQGEITSIDAVRYEFTDLYIEYVVEIIQPWSKWAMDKAVHENRVATFKVIEGKH